MKTLVCALLLVLPLHLFCQNRFSQFYSSPLLFNPANSGRFNKGYRIGGAFRSEKMSNATVYTQRTAFFDSKILNSLIPDNDCLAVGLLALTEQSSAQGIKNVYFSTTLGYQKSLSDEGGQILGVGFQTTFARRNIRPPRLIQESQIKNWLYSGLRNIDISQLQEVNFSYVDLAVGLIYQGYVNDRNFFSAGMSYSHVNRPNKSFLGGEFNLTPRIDTRSIYSNK